jgi:hypothetical protein
VDRRTDQNLWVTPGRLASDLLRDEGVRVDRQMKPVLLDYADGDYHDMPVSGTLLDARPAQFVPREQMILHSVPIHPD